MMGTLPVWQKNQKSQSTVFWLDYFTVNRTSALDSIPRQFGFMPARFTNRLGYLRGVRWGVEAWKRLLLKRG